MKSTIKEIELNENYPCLMEYKVQGDFSIGVYLVNKYDDGQKKKYSVCRVVCSDESGAIGEVYFKDEINPREWSFLPKGTVVTITN